MLPFLILAGIPRGAYQRLKGKQLAIPSWNFLIRPSKDHEKAELRADDPEEILAKTVQSPEGGHVLAFSQVSGRQKDLAHEIRRHLRFRWLNNEYLKLLYANFDQFMSVIKQEAIFEMEWRKSLRPKDQWSPLLLPQSVFTSKIGGMLWDEAAAVGPTSIGATREIDRVRRFADCFVEAHKQHGEWLDAKDLKFKIGERHAHPPEEVWMWKFSWRVQDGFHYDVTHARGHGFNVTDSWDSTRHSIRNNWYINIDCHGRCRPSP